MRPMNARRASLVALLVALLTAHAAVAAQGDHGRDHGNEGEGLSPEQAAAVVKRTYEGRVVSVKPEGSDGERIYKVRVLLDGGRVKTVQVDSRGNVRDSN